MTKIVPLSDVDPAAVEALLDAAFGASRKTRTAYKMRARVEFIPALSFAVVDSTTLVASIQCWPVALDDGAVKHPMVLVGPVAVDPAAQGQGFGKAVMEAMLAAALAEDVGVLVMIGDPDYYGRFFGFVADHTSGWRVPGPVERHRLLARIKPGLAATPAGSIIPDLTFAAVAE